MTTKRRYVSWATILAWTVFLVPFVGADLSDDAKARIAALKQNRTVPVSAATPQASPVVDPAPQATTERTADGTGETKGIAAGPPAPASATSDVVVMTNGDRLSGKLIDMFSGTLKFSAHGNAAIVLPWKNVATLSTVERYRVTLAKGGALDGPINSLRPGAFTIGTPIGVVMARTTDVQSIDNFPAIAKKEQELEEKLRFDLRNVWTGLVSVGLADTTGNSESKNVNFSAEATRKSPGDKIFLDGHYNKTSAAGVTSADQVRGGMRLDVNITKKRFYFLFGRLEIDKIKELDLRTTVGAGLGNVFYDHPRGHLDIGWGITYVRDTYEFAPKESDRTFLLSLNWSRKVAKDFSFKERLLVYPNLEEFSDYRIEADTKFDYNLADDLAITLGFVNRFDTEPLPGKEKHDMTVTTSITKRY